MCELLQLQIHDSPSDGMTADVFAAMNHVTLDIIGLAGAVPSIYFPTSCHYLLVVGLERPLTRRLCNFSLRVWIQL